MNHINLLIVVITAGLLLAAFLSALNFMWLNASVCAVWGLIGLAYIDRLEGSHNDL